MRNEWSMVRGQGSVTGPVATRHGFARPCQPSPLNDSRISPLSPAPCPLTPAKRRGISLIEVLVSMFVLLFGLLGVAAVFPVGNHYAGRGEQYDRGSALTGAAFAELKARGMLRPQYWMYPSNPSTPTPVMVNGAWNPSSQTGGPGHAFVIDSLGAAAADYANPLVRVAEVFPYALFNSSQTDGVRQGDPLQSSNVANPWVNATAPKPSLSGASWPLRRVTLPQAGGQPMTAAVAQLIFDLQDDLTQELPKESDRPSIQRWSTVDSNNTPNDAWDDTLLKRQNTGSYSWLATVVPTTISARDALQPLDPQYGNALYEVSVAVFHKRVPTPSAATERAIAAELHSGGELVLYDAGSYPSDSADAIDAATKDIRAGQWIALAGVHPTTGQFLLKWYRIASLDEETNDAASPVQRRAMLEGADWPWDLKPPSASNQPDIATNLRAILLPGVIGVSTQTLTMQELE